MVHSAIVEEMRVAGDIHRRAVAGGFEMLQTVRAGRPIAMGPVEELAGEIVASVRRNHNALLFFSHVQDRQGCIHGVGAAAVMVILAEQLCLSGRDVHHAAVAGLVHDLGNFRVDPVFLDKPGMLSSEEFRDVSRHTMHGVQLLAEANYTVPEVCDAVRHHHERLNGTGYPDALWEEEIPVITRMAAIADFYNAVIRDRAYRKALAPREAMALLHEVSPGQFDPGLVDAFTRCAGLAPPGSLVRLASRRLAVVIEARAEAPDQPVVAAFFDTHAFARTPVEVIDLATDRRESIQSAETPADWGVDLHADLEIWSRLH